MRACEQERKTSIEAAALASASSMRRAELEDENAQLLDALIASKLQCAEIAQRYEEDRKKVWTMKRRLQRYATRVASLEVAETLRSQKFSPSRDRMIPPQQHSQYQQQQSVNVRQPMRVSDSTPQSTPVTTYSNRPPPAPSGASSGTRVSVAAEGATRQKSQNPPDTGDRYYRRT